MICVSVEKVLIVHPKQCIASLFEIVGLNTEIKSDLKEQMSDCKK